MSETVSKEPVALLKECESGCKMAENSLDQVTPFAKDEKMQTLLKESRKTHEEIGNECHKLLNEYGAPERDPHPTAKVFSWISTEFKLAIDSGNHQIASLMTDGCNMGVKSLSKYLNQYAAADEVSKDITKRLISLEEKLAKDMRGFL